MQVDAAAVAELTAAGYTEYYARFALHKCDGDLPQARSALVAWGPRSKGEPGELGAAESTGTAAASGMEHGAEAHAGQGAEQSADSSVAVYRHVYSRTKWIVGLCCGATAWQRKGKITKHQRASAERGGRTEASAGAGSSGAEVPQCPASPTRAAAAQDELEPGVREAERKVTSAVRERKGDPLAAYDADVRAEEAALAELHAWINSQALQ